MSRNKDEIEREANQFAMSLLMPKEMLMDEINKIGGINLVDDTQVMKLAKTFKVPITAMALRLGQIFNK